MQQAKKFSEKLNKHLDDLGMPDNTRERAIILSKMLHITKQEAWTLLESHTPPSSDLLSKLAAELEIDPKQFS